MYNAKILQYENGMIEIRTYSDFVGKSQPRRKDSSRDYEWLEYNPFSGKVESFVKMPCGMSFAEGLKVREENRQYSEEQKKRRSESNSYKRTVQSIYAISRQCSWEYFITLTFDKEVVDRYGFDECMKKAKKWFNNQRNRYAPDLQYLVVPELHKDGAWHLHGLLANVGSMDIGKTSRLIDKKKLDNGQWITLKKPIELKSVGGWRFGFSDCSVVQDVKKVSSYITKYITKELCTSTEGKHRYFRSNNIPEVTTSEYQIDFENPTEFINFVAEQFDCSIGYQKKVSGEYLTATYTFLQDKEEN